MTDVEAGPAYFWLTSSRVKKPVQDDVPYTTQALRQDLLRVRNAWDECQANRNRDAIYGYLTAIFDLVAGGPLKIALCNELARLCAYGTSSNPITTNRSPQSSVPLPIPSRLTSARGPSGRACCGTLWQTSRHPSHWIGSSSATVVSTNAQRGSPVILVDSPSIVQPADSLQSKPVGAVHCTTINLVKC